MIVFINLGFERILNGAEQDTCGKAFSKSSSFRFRFVPRVQETRLATETRLGLTRVGPVKRVTLLVRIEEAAARVTLQSGHPIIWRLLAKYLSSRNNCLKLLPVVEHVICF